MTNTAAPMEAIYYKLPDDWTHVSPDEREIEKLLSTALENLENEGIELFKGHQRAMEASLGELRRRIQGANLTSMGVYIDYVAPDDGKEDHPGDLVIATCALRVVSQEDADTELPLTPELLSAVFSQQTEPTSLLKDRYKKTALEPPAIVELPAGRALLLREILEYQKNLADVVKMYTQAYMVPHDENYDHLSILQLTTPNVNFSKNFSGLFHSIAKTLTFVREGDPSLTTAFDEETAD